MKRKIIIHTIIFIGLIFIIGCKEDPESKTEYRYISDDIKAFMFEVGTYWIYENDSTGAIDSISIINTEHDYYWGPPSIHGEPGIKHEFYNIELKNFTSSETYNDFLTSTIIKRNGGGEYGQYGQPIYITGQEIGYDFNGLEIIDKFSSIIINGNNFSNIDLIKISFEKQYQEEFNYDTYLYYDHDIGLVKWTTIIDENEIESWSINKWNIIK